MAISEFFRAAMPEAYLGIYRSDIDPLIAGIGNPGLLSQISYLFDLHTINAPPTINVNNGENTTDSILVVDLEQLQVDGSLNEVPHATVSCGVGRDAQALIAGATDFNAMSVAHILELYLGLTQVPAKIYAHVTTTSSAGLAPDGTDNTDWPDEWVILFDGIISSQSRRGTGDNAQIIFHLVHFTAVLGFSSSMTAQVAAGTNAPIAYSPLSVFSNDSGMGLAATAWGLSTIALAGGATAETDFWGYQVPGAAQPTLLNDSALAPSSVGLKGWLAMLAQLDTFAWETLLTADLGAGKLPDPTPKPNVQALAALLRIEPIWPAWNNGAAASTWNTIQTAAQALNTGRPAGPAIDRSDLIDVAGAAYSGSGYTYGVPISFYLNLAVLGPFSLDRGFASDIYAASFNDLSAASFLDLLVGAYASRYQLALVPMADRALVIPFQPLLASYWQFISASEILSFNDDYSTPRPLRGVVLAGDHNASTGWAAGSDPSLPGAMQRLQQASAVYDSGQPGVFLYRSMPTWLLDAYRPFASYASYTLPSTGKNVSAVPWVTKEAASAVGDVLLAAVGGALGDAGKGYAIAGMIRGALLTPPVWALSTACRLAQSLYQQEFLRHRSLYLTTRFRYDIGPGSIIKVAVPCDRYVRATLVGAGGETVTGMVLRVTLQMDRKTETASTSFQLGFVRSEGEQLPSSPLYANAHPFWSTACIGVPWCDAQWIRTLLGANATLVGP